MAIIKVVSYNIKNGQGMDGKIDLTRVFEVLKDQDADCISLQEVDLFRPRSFLRNQAGSLARMLKMDYVFGPAISYRIGAFGNAILTRFPIVKTTNHQLPASQPRRAMLEVHLDVRGEILRLFNTHMELDRKLRLKQIQNFIVPLLLSANSAAILSGDLNETPAEPGVKYLCNYLQDSFAANSGSLTTTFRADNPLERMDYILLNQSCAAIDYQIVPSLASDHLPVVSLIELI